jgi:SPP1 family predicted phage head-tail adaptor
VTGGTVDDHNQSVLIWDDVFTVWGEFRAESGGESVQAAQPRGDVRCRLTVRRSPLTEQVTSAFRVVIGERQYEIEAVLPDSNLRDRLVMPLRLVPEAAPAGALLTDDGDDEAIVWG